MEKPKEVYQNLEVEDWWLEKLTIEEEFATIDNFWKVASFLYGDNFVNEARPREKFRRIARVLDGNVANTGGEDDFPSVESVILIAEMDGQSQPTGNILIRELCAQTPENIEHSIRRTTTINIDNSCVNPLSIRQKHAYVDDVGNLKVRNHVNGYEFMYLADMNREEPGITREERILMEAALEQLAIRASAVA